QNLFHSGIPIEKESFVRPFVSIPDLFSNPFRWNPWLSSPLVPHHKSFPITLNHLDLRPCVPSFDRSPVFNGILPWRPSPFRIGTKIFVGSAINRFPLVIKKKKFLNFPIFVRCSQRRQNTV